MFNLKNETTMAKSRTKKWEQMSRFNKVIAEVSNVVRDKKGNVVKTFYNLFQLR